MESSDATKSSVLAAMTWPSKTQMAPFFRLLSTGLPVAMVSALMLEPGTMVQKIPRQSSPHLERR